MNKSIHQTVIKLGVEEFFVWLRGKVNFLRRFVPVGFRHKFASIGKFVPESSSYPKNDSYFLTRDNTSFKINRSDYVQWRIFYGVRDNALKQAKESLTSDSIILDIGANCGAFSLKLASHAASLGIRNFQIHAFEPNPIVFKSLNANLALNPMAAGIVNLHPIGFGRERKQQSFQYPDTNTGVGRVLQHDTKTQFKVMIERLDDFVAELNPSKIAFIKLIVEGFEPEVFKGGWETLRNYKPPIFFEVTREWYEENSSSVDEVLKGLRDLGYQFQGEYYNDMVPYPNAKFDSLYQYNLLAENSFKKQ